MALKKLLSMLLAIMMVVGTLTTSFVVTVSADEENPETGDTENEGEEEEYRLHES